MFAAVLRSLQDVHEMNAYMTDHVPVRMTQHEHRWTDFDETWYGRCHLRLPLTRLFNFLQMVISIWRTNELMGWD